MRESRRALRERARLVNDRLAELHPDAHCELAFRDPYQLLLATVLSAQTTDARVNQVTPELFARYPDAVALAGAAKLRREGAIGRDETVVVVATAHAIKFSGAAVRYHGSDARHANPARSLPASLEAVAGQLRR